MTYVVADLHGNQTKFRQLLQEISFRETDVLYVIGDIVDYGDESMELIVDLSVRYNVYPILGDHDLRAARMLSGFEKMLKTGTDKPDSSYVTEMMAWMQDGGQKTLEDMALYEEVTLKGKHYLLVHAGIAGFGPGVSLEDLGPEAFVTEPLDMTRAYLPDTTVIVGHVPTADGKIAYGNGSICIDCGTAESGRIGCLRLDDGCEFYI